ncbi:hypothetical protein SAMN04490178_10180 [Propionispora vibrioides]|uniref:Uncharacterized protein n=2 Tax=Propionispora TaxID=112902 RepID=A0A1H8NG23_9FIRM|nr:hypothetical protein SAMN04490178_10180 [Propionispora vibrioides]
MPLVRHTSLLYNSTLTGFFAYATNKKSYAEVHGYMLAYIVVGAAIGTFIGQLLPPGGFIGFVVGTVTGFCVQKYISHRSF